MEHRRFGLTKFEVPVIGQGTWHMEDDDRDMVIAALRRGLDLGVRHIDTAEIYGAGVIDDAFPLGPPPTELPML